MGLTETQVQRDRFIATGMGRVMMNSEVSTVLNPIVQAHAPPPASR